MLTLSCGNALIERFFAIQKPALNSGRTVVPGARAKRCRKLQALTPGSAISEEAVRGRLLMFVWAAGSARSVTWPRFEVRELGEIDMASGALGALDLVGHGDARPASPAVFLEGHTVLSYGELAGSVGESERVLRQQRRELVELLGVPGRHVVFWPVGQLPRTPGGKVDYQSLATVMDSRGGPVDGAEELAATLGPGT
jgi:hypothetical protein